MDTKIYVPLNKLIEERFGTLKLTVSYTLGGYSYWNSKTITRGIYLYLTPVNRGGSNFEESIMMGGGRSAGYKILLETLTRGNKRKVEDHFHRIKSISNEIAELYLAEKDPELYKLVTE